MGKVQFWNMGEYESDYNIYTIDEYYENLFIEYATANFNPSHWGYHSGIIYCNESQTEDLLEEMLAYKKEQDYEEDSEENEECS